jgi:hypothetical protein
MNTQKTYRLAQLMNRLHPTEVDTQELCALMAEDQQERDTFANAMCFLAPSPKARLRVEPAEPVRSSSYVWRPGNKRMTRE